MAETVWVGAGEKTGEIQRSSSKDAVVRHGHRQWARHMGLGPSDEVIPESWVLYGYDYALGGVEAVVNQPFVQPSLWINAVGNPLI